MTVLAGAVACLRDAGVPFALVGAAAMAAHGLSRSTADIDLMTTDSRVLQAAFWRIDADVDVRRGDPSDPLEGVVRLSAPGETLVDIVVGRHDWQRRVIEQARPISFEDVTAPVVARSGLILLKLYAGGSQDAWDILQLLDTPEGVSSIADVERILPELPRDAADLWRQIKTRPS
jgi:hypothetical protein